MNINMKKICVANFSGGTGKTQVVTNLLSPRLPDAQIISVESINETAEATGGVEVEKIRGSKFRSIISKVMDADSVILDVGASNVEDFLEGLKNFDGGAEEFDLFLVPVTSGTKEQREAILMIELLTELGVPKERISVVFNKSGDNVAEEFGRVISHIKKTDSATFDVECAIPENELFDLISARKVTVSSLVEDEVDYRTKMREETDPVLRAKYKDTYILRSLAINVDKNLNKVFQILAA